MPKFLSVQQGSDAWLKAREGRITASRIKDVLAFNKNGKESQKRYDYRMELILERMSGRAASHFVSKYMDWGTEYEPMARAAYEMAFNVMTECVGFALHPTMDFSGASPDSLVDRDGMIEIKCPERSTHLEYLMAGVVPEEYKPQMYWGMACCERNWCDFVSYDPWQAEGFQVFCKRLEYDHAIVSDIAGKVRHFNEEIEAAISQLRGGNPLKDALKASLEAE